MILRGRPAQPEDFLGYRDGLAFAYGPDPEVRANLPEFWRRCLGLPGIWSQVVENTEAPMGRRLVFFSLTAFISEAFYAELQRGEEPFIAAAFVRRFFKGGGALLDLEGMRKEQAGNGLYSMNLHSVSPLVAPGIQAPTVIAEYAARRNFDAMRGYRLTGLMREVFSPEARDGYTEGGWRLRTTYGWDGPPSPEHPNLLGILKSELGRSSGARMAEMFVERPPRLGLRRAHRELLEAALEGLTDEEMSERFSLSLSAVKKRWLSVYDHVDRRHPGLLPFDAARPERSRGAERRRHLLNFLREHPEEFRSLEE